MARCKNQISIEEEARNYYLNKMDSLLNSEYGNQLSNVFDMKKKHVEYKFEAVDILRKKSIEMANTWKLEKDINDQYSHYVNLLRERRNSITD